MMDFRKITALLCAVALAVPVMAATPEPAHQGDGRLEWWRNDRFGMFIHYGLYSQCEGYWKDRPVEGIGEWIMKIGKIPVAEYQTLARTFTCSEIDPEGWVALARESGMKYLVITAKHHDGFALFDSEADPFNIVDATPYGKDLIRQVVDACHRQGMKIGLYYSQFQDWSYPGAGGNDWEEGYGYDPASFEKYMQKKALPQVRELLTNYGKIDMIWFDTPGRMTEEQSRAFLDLAHGLQPGIIVSGRVGNDLGDYVQMEDNDLPSVRPDLDWEAPVTMNHTWAYKRDDHDWKTVPHILWQLTRCASMGGNYLLNIGPEGDGSVPEESRERLAAVGEWMRSHGHTIWNTIPGPFPVAADWGNVTVRGEKMFLHVTDWPKDGQIALYGLHNEVRRSQMLVSGKEVPFYEQGGFLHLDLTGVSPEGPVSTVVVEVVGTPVAEQDLVQEEDGCVKLEVQSAENHTGCRIRFGSVNKWLAPKGRLDWEFVLHRPGSYRVEVVTTGYKQMAFPDQPALWDGGHEVVLEIAGQKLEGTVGCDRVENPPHELYNDFKVCDLGTVDLEETGLLSLSLKPVSIVKENKAGLAVRMIRLVPVSEEAGTVSGKIYGPTWESLDSRPVPQWFTDAKFGIFIHWGLYSVPGFSSKGSYAEWYWNALNEDPEKAKDKRLERHLAITDFHQRVYGKDFPYSGFRDGFRAELFNPEEWADIFKRSGARYVVLTSKHHDGYCLWPNEEASESYGMPWNSVSSGPHRDLVGELTEAVRKTDVKMGLYYSIWDWYNPLWTAEQQNLMKSGSMAVDFKKAGKDSGVRKNAAGPEVAAARKGLSDYIHQVMYPQFKELVRKYSPSLIFSDGDWWMSDDLWETRPLLAWLYNNAPNREEVVINDRWGKVRGKHGGYFTTEYGSGFENSDRPWEENRGIGRSFGINRIENIDDYNTDQELLFMLADIVSRGGNLLLNIGPSPDGTIPVIMQERLLQIGEWLDVNGEAIYATHPYRRTAQWSEGKMPVFTKDDYHAGFPVFEMTVSPKPGNARKEMWFTSKEDVLYALLPGWPEKDEAVIKEVKLQKGASVSLLGLDRPLPWKICRGNLHVDLSDVRPSELPCRHIFVLKIDGCQTGQD